MFDLVGHNEWVKSMDFHPLEAILCSSDNFDVLEVWDLIQCVRLKNFLVSNSHSYVVNSLANMNNDPFFFNIIHS